MPVALHRPRRARASPLWQCLADHREAFFEQYGARFEKLDGWLRPEVTETLDAFKACGDLSRGFARPHCDHCGHDYLVAYELEPWEQARRQRLETYAQLRDEVAGIVVYDGKFAKGSVQFSMFLFLENIYESA